MRTVLIALAVGGFAALGVYLWLQEGYFTRMLDQSEVEKVQEDVPTMDVVLYYYMADNDTDGDGNSLCSRNGLIAVKRTLPVGSRVEDTLNLLLSGALSEDERREDITTEFPLSGLSVERVLHEEGKVIITLDDTNNKTRGGACRTALLWYQIEATMLQFDDVVDVEFRPNDLFQP